MLVLHIHSPISSRTENVRIGCTSASACSSRAHFSHSLSNLHRGAGARVRLSKRVQPRCGAGDYSSKDGRRKGRPAFTPGPDDTPLRDGNRDRLIGLLTVRAVHTLLHYTMETNQQLHNWIREYYNSSPIPIKGNWEDVSGDTFLRKLLQSPIAEAGAGNGIDPLFDCCAKIGVDPRSIAHRIMDIRTALAKEWAEDLLEVAGENGALLKESLLGSLMLSIDEGSIDEDLQEEWRAREKRIRDGPEKVETKTDTKDDMEGDNVTDETN